MLAPPHSLHLLLFAPFTLVLADALLASASLALVRADARPPALRALAPDERVLADAAAPALLAFAPLTLVRADALPPALLPCAPGALVRADARPPALLALLLSRWCWQMPAKAQEEARKDHKKT